MSLQERAPSSGNTTQASTGLADTNLSLIIQGEGAISIWYWDHNSGRSKGYGCIPYDLSITALRVNASRQTIDHQPVQLLVCRNGSWTTYDSPVRGNSMSVGAGFCGPQYGAGRPKNWDNTINFADQNGKRCRWDNDLNNWIAE